MYNRCAASPIPESSQSDFSLRRLLQTAIVHTHSTVLYQLCPIHTVENRGEKIEEAKLRADGPIYERCCPPRPQLLHDFALVVSRLRLLGEEVRLLRTWGSLKFNISDIRCVGKR